MSILNKVMREANKPANRQRLLSMGQDLMDKRSGSTRGKRGSSSKSGGLSGLLGSSRSSRSRKRY